MDGVVAHVLPGAESRRSADEKDAERPLGLLAADRPVGEKTVLIEDRVGLGRVRLDGTCAERVVRDVLKDRVTGKDAVVAVLKPQVAVPFGHDHDVRGQFDQAQDHDDRDAQRRLGIAGEAVSPQRFWQGRVGHGGAKGASETVPGKSSIARFAGTGATGTGRTTGISLDRHPAHDGQPAGCHVLHCGLSLRELDADHAVSHPKIMHAKRFEELKATGALPSPTGVGLEILRLARDDQASASDIARVIQADPALTGPDLATGQHGQRGGFAARDQRRRRRRPARHADGERRGAGFHRSSPATAAGSAAASTTRGTGRIRWPMRSPRKSSASQTRAYDGADGFTAGLLAQIGRLALASIHPEQYAAVLAEWAEGSPADLVRLEQKAFVTNHNELSAAMMADWGLPKPVCDAVLYQEDPAASDLPSGPQSRQLCPDPSRGIADRRRVPGSERLAGGRLRCRTCSTRCEAIGIESEAAHALFDRVFFQWAEWGRVLDISTAKSAQALGTDRGGTPQRSVPATPSAAPAQTARRSTAAIAVNARDDSGKSCGTCGTGSRRKLVGAFGAAWPTRTSRRCGSSKSSSSSRATRCAARRGGTRRCRRFSRRPRSW